MIYNDRSRIDGYTGCGLVNPESGAGCTFSLGRFSTVFQGETAAILECAADIERNGVER